jgi:hypothetical protein
LFETPKGRDYLRQLLIDGKVQIWHIQDVKIVRVDSSDSGQDVMEHICEKALNSCVP